MAWTSTQKQLAVRACRAAGITEEQRTDMILRGFRNAHYKGDITSTAPRLTNGDYENFMAIVENFAKGKILHFTAGYWKACAADGLSRMRGKARALAAELEREGRLAPGGAGLAGWIEKRVSQGTTRRIEDLDYHGMLALILGLTAYRATGGSPGGLNGVLSSGHGCDPMRNKHKNPRLPKSMQFRVGPWRYDVRMSRAKLTAPDGSPAAALWMWDKRLLLISCNLNAHCRLDALVHELRHAWQSHFGTPKDDEGDANNAASFTVDFMRQFIPQGGEDFLLEMESVR